MKTLRHAAIAVCLAGATASAQQLPEAGTPLPPPPVGGPQLPPPDVFAGVTTATDPEGGPVSYADIVNPRSDFYRRTQSFVPSDPELRVIYNAARGVGLRAGFASEAARINAVVAREYQGWLDRRFDFRQLMIQQFVVPPVVTRIDDVQEVEGGRLLALTAGSFEIVKQARLSTTSPRWEQYLILPVQTPAAPRGLSVDTAAKREVWEDAATIGWYAGMVEARRSYVTGWNILNRDFDGMRRYHEMARRGIVSLPDLERRVQAWQVSDDGQRADANQQTLELRVDPRFRTR